MSDSAETEFTLPAACYKHLFWLRSLEGPMWSHKATWDCLKCDKQWVTRGNRPKNYPYIEACDRLTSDVDALILITRCMAITVELMIEADRDAFTIWKTLAGSPALDFLTEDLPEPRILAIIDRLVTAKCDVTHYKKHLRVRKPAEYTETIPWTSSET